MHPIRFFLDEIYQDYWGVQEARQPRVRKQEERGFWMRSRPLKQIDSRKH